MGGLRQVAAFELSARTGRLAVRGSPLWRDLEGGARVGGWRWCSGFSSIGEREEGL